MIDPAPPETEEPRPIIFPADPTIVVQTPIVTYVLIALSVAIYFAQISTNVIFQLDIPAYFGMKINEAIIGGEYWRFVTPMLLHGSIPHILFNMYALFSIGNLLERRMGHGRFLLLYLLGSFAGNAFSFLLSPNPSLGASTSIFALIGAEAIFFWHNRELFGKQARRALRNIFMIVAVNLFFGLSPGIDNWGHIGGLIGGLMFAWFGGPKFAVSQTTAYPFVQMEDEHGASEVITGAMLVILCFGALAAWGIFFR